MIGKDTWDYMTASTKMYVSVLHLKSADYRFQTAYSRPQTVDYKILTKDCSSQILKNTELKVAIYIQECLKCKQCSECSLSSRYLNPYIRLRFIELAIKLYHEFWDGLPNFSRPLNASNQMTFWKLQVKVKFVFCHFHFFPRFQGPKYVFSIFNCSKKLQNILEWSNKTHSLKKTISKLTIPTHVFVIYMLN